LYILIAGFGRSGTTWLSDIIARTLNQLILFEPFHPSVNETYSKKYAYNSLILGKEYVQLYEYLDNILYKNIRSPWLLRNALHHDIAHNKLTEGFLNKIWDNSEIIGIKSIRLNFQLHNMSTIFKKIIYIERNPYDVISSILSRNFYEFGKEETFNIFFKNSRNTNIKFQYPLNRYGQIERLTHMWGLTTQYIKYIKSRYTNIKFLKYEDLYSDPYLYVREIFDYLNIDEHIYPQHIFHPSITTNKTFHGISNSPKFSKLTSVDIEIINCILNEYYKEIKHENLYFR